MATMSQSATRASSGSVPQPVSRRTGMGRIDEDRRVCEVHSGSAVTTAGPLLHEAALPRDGQVRER